MTLGVFTFVLLLGNVLKEVLPLLVSGQASVWMAGEFVGLLIPYVWLYALPISVLAAILLSFGRFSADHELTAARASGISLLALTLPVLVLSLVLCGVCAWINLELGPHCRKTFRDLRLQFLTQLSGALLPEGQFVRDFPGYIFYVGKNDGGKLREVMIVATHEDGSVTKVRADEGTLEVDPSPTNRVFRLNLTGVRSITLSPDHELIYEKGNAVLEVPITKAERNTRRVVVSDLTFSEIQAEMKDLQTRVDFSSARQPTNAAAAIEFKRELKRLKADTLSPLRVELHKKIALSFSCFGFALVGIPLGIRVQRRESNIGFAVALVLVAIYYAFILLGSALETKPQYYPHLLMWVPNLIFQAVGGTLLWRVNRGL